MLNQTQAALQKPEAYSNRKGSDKEIPFSSFIELNRVVMIPYLLLAPELLCTFTVAGSTQEDVPS